MADYRANHLAGVLRQGSLGRDSAKFCETRTLGALWQNAERLAAVLNVQPGDRVVVHAEKCIEFIELYLACVLAGAIFVPLNPAYTDAEMAYFLGDAEPALLVCDRPRFEGLSNIAVKARVVTLDRLIDSALHVPGTFKLIRRNSNHIAAILYTSGTTGRSKGAMLSHKALASNAVVLAEHWRFTCEDVLIHALPVFHTHGLFVATNTALVSGASMIFQARFDPAAVVAAMPQASVLMGVPTFYTRLLGIAGLAEASKGMRLFVSGSAPLLAETFERFFDVTGHAILERYGMTETNMNTSNPYVGERRAGTVGMPLPGVEMRLRDVVDGIGGIEVRGPNVFSGYWRLPEKTGEELSADGWFVTGDLGRVDADGYVSIVGRAKDLVITGGLNVYPKEIEDVIDAIPGVVESAVIGVLHPDFGEAVVAVVVGDVSEVEVMAGCAAVLAKFKQPKRVILADELPRNLMGKVQKKALRQELKGLFDSPTPRARS